MAMNFLGVFGHANVDFIFRLPKLPKSNQTAQVLEREIFWRLQVWVEKHGILAR